MQEEDLTAHEPTLHPVTLGSQLWLQKLDFVMCPMCLVEDLQHRERLLDQLEREYEKKRTRTLDILILNL